MNSLEIDKKKSFKVILNSRNANSRTGSGPNNYSYFVDLRTVVRTNLDYSKQYKIYCSLVSTLNTITGSGIDPTTNNYSLHIDAGKGQNIYQYSLIRPPSFILPVVCVPLGTTTATSLFGFLLEESDQQPVIINDIRDIATINLNIITNNNGAFAPGANFEYIASLTFEEC